MRILALDTTTPTASAAIWTDGELTGVYTIRTTTHSTTVLPMVESLLATLSLSISDMDMLAVSAGPGSFTGVRIGVATLKGLAFSQQIPCVGVSSLEALARNLAGYRGILCPVINARRGHVYTALFEADGIHPPKRLTEDDLVSVADLAEKLQTLAQPIFAAGDGYDMLKKALPEGDLVPVPLFLRAPHAFGTADVAAQVYQEAEDKSIFTEAALVPLYLRKSQAEREREERLANNESKE